MWRVSRNGLLIMVWLASVAHGEEVCFKRFMPDKCDAFRDKAENLKSEISENKPGYDIVIGPERYNETTGKFLTDLSFDFVGNNNDVFLETDFCNIVNDFLETGNKDCLGMTDKIDSFITPNTKITLEGACSRNKYEQGGVYSQRLAEFQLADALRAYDRAIFYNNNLTINPLLNEKTITAELPLLTTDKDFAKKYANESFVFLLYSSKQRMECIDDWHIDVTRPDNNAHGMWKVTLEFRVDEVCQGDEETAVCQDGWQPPDPGKEWVCEGENCYERASCVPLTCAVNEYGQNCATCESGKFSLKSGNKAQKLNKCIDRSNASTACQQIADLKLTPCSSDITPKMKRLLSLVLDVDCNDDGSIQLTWGKRKSEILQDNTDVFHFIKNVFNVTEDEFTLQYVQRGVVEEEGPGRRRLLSQDTAIDDSVTLITYTRTTGTAQSSSTSSSSSSDNGMIFAIILTVAGVLAICAVLVGCKSSGLGSSGTSAAGVQLFHVQEHAYTPLYVSPSPKP